MLLFRKRNSSSTSSSQGSAYYYSVLSDAIAGRRPRRPFRKEEKSAIGLLKAGVERTKGRKESCEWLWWWAWEEEEYETKKRWHNHKKSVKLWKKETLKVEEMRTVKKKEIRFAFGRTKLLFSAFGSGTKKTTERRGSMCSIGEHDY